MMHRRTIALWLLVFTAIVSLIGSLFVGSVNLPLSGILAALAGHGSHLDTTLVLKLRLPRTLAAFSTGGLLGVAGALMQVLLRNPLADPYVLGVSGGAAAGALFAMLAGLGGTFATASGFGGALFSIFIVFVLSYRAGTWTPTRMLLTGIVVAAGWSAVITLLLALSPDATLRGMLFWMMGDLAYRSAWQLPMCILGFTVATSWPLSRQLNVLASGETSARTLGVPVEAVTIWLYLLSSLATTVSVVEAGTIGFIGLIVPHMLRLSAGSNHRIVIPGSALGGGILLTWADMIARSVAAPRALPVGVVTAAIGVPLFLYLLLRSRNLP